MEALSYIEMNHADTDECHFPQQLKESFMIKVLR